MPAWRVGVNDGFALDVADLVAVEEGAFEAVVLGEDEGEVEELEVVVGGDPAAGLVEAMEEDSGAACLPAHPAGGLGYPAGRRGYPKPVQCGLDLGFGRASRRLPREYLPRLSILDPRRDA